MNEKERILRDLEEEYKRWEQLLAGVSVEQISEPDLPAGLSLKDVMAHLWAWQQRSIARLEAAREEREPVFPSWPENLDPNSEDDLDDINAWIYNTNHERSWDDVYADWRAGYRRFMDLGQAISEQDLLTPGRYAWIWGHPLSFILEASYGHHHDEHYEPLVAWLSEQRREHGSAPAGE